MQIRRTATILGTVVFGAATFLGTGIANAATTPATDWGVNKDGWHVNIDNESSQLLGLEQSLFGNVKHGDEWLYSKAPGTVEGLPSHYSGPANIDFVYRNTWASRDGVAIRISSTSEGAVKADCRPVKPDISTRFTCDVTKAGPTEPIEITIRDK